MNLNLGTLILRNFSFKALSINLCFIKHIFLPLKGRALQNLPAACLTKLQDQIKLEMDTAQIYLSLVFSLIIKFI
jgi:hypothetical protein